MQWSSAMIICLCILAFILPVAAAADNDDMIELLEYTTVNDSGTNMFSFTTESTIELDVPQYSRLRYIDILFTTSNSVVPTSVSIRYNGIYTKLTIQTISAGTYRAYGTTNAYYDSLFLRFQASGSTTKYYTILSCKVSLIPGNDFAASGSIYFDSDGDQGNFSVGTDININPSMTTEAAGPYEARIDVSDWTKFDMVHLWGYSMDASIESISCILDDVPLPVDVSFLDVEAHSYLNPEDLIGIGDIAAYGRYLYTVSVDLSGVDRSRLTGPLSVTLTGNYDYSWGMTFNCQYISGSIYVADTSDASWWYRFTAFLSDLMQGDSSDADEQQSQIETQVGALEDAGEALQQVERPDLDAVDIDVSGDLSPTALAQVADFTGVFLGNELFSSIIFMVLTVSLVAWILYGKR